MQLAQNGVARWHKTSAAVKVPRMWFYSLKLLYTSLDCMKLVRVIVSQNMGTTDSSQTPHCIFFIMSEGKCTVLFKGICIKINL
jgi:hypothetical protein